MKGYCYMNPNDDCMTAGGFQSDRSNSWAALPGVTVASLFQGGPVRDFQQIDTYLEDLLKEDHLSTTLNKRSLESGQVKGAEHWEG